MVVEVSSADLLSPIEVRCTVCIIDYFLLAFIIDAIAIAIAIVIAIATIATITINVIDVTISPCMVLYVFVRCKKCLMHKFDF